MKTQSRAPVLQYKIKTGDKDLIHGNTVYKCKRAEMLKNPSASNIFDKF